jgi:hypothetical protein
MFGYGSSTPYNASSIKNRNLLPGGIGPNKNGTASWYQSRMEDAKDFQTMLSDWKEMASYAPISAATRIIVEECIQTEHSCPATLWAEGGDSETEETVNELFTQTLDCDTVIRSQFWWIVTYGNSIEKLTLGPQGVHGWRFVDLDKVERIVDTQHRLVGFKDLEENPPEGEGNSVLWGNQNDQQIKLWRPWDYCFTADTKISLLDGRELSIELLQKEVGDKEFWVYSSTPQGRIVPGHAHSLRKTSQNAKIVEVGLDNGEKVKCTPNHLFMLRDGTYKEAELLQPGDSLMPLYRRLSTFEEHGREGYEIFLDQSCGKELFTHYRVAEEIYGTKRDTNGRFSKSYHVHHQDFNRRNNDPKNLKWLIVSEHNKLHLEINEDPIHKEKQRQGASEGLKRTWALKREEMTQKSRQAILNQIQKRLDQTGSKVTTAMREASIRNGKLYGPQNIGRKFTKPEEIEQRHQAGAVGGARLKEKLQTDITLLQKYVERGKLTAKKLHSLPRNPINGRFNHKVLYVKPLGNADVYDFTVDEYHNFALSAGVFVHNCHMRLLGEERNTEYGTSLLKPATQVYKRLRMSEDQMVTYRLQLQPSRYLMKVDTGESTTTDIWDTINQWKQYLRSTKNIDPDKNTYEVRYNPWSLDDIIILPLRKDSTSDFTKMEGDSEVPDITDVKYLMRLLAGMLNIPPEFLGVEPEGGSSLVSKSSLAVQDLRFLRSIKAVRSSVMQAYDKVARIHLALRDKDPFIPFKVKMSNITALESESQMELINNQADLADKLITLGNNIQAPKEEWLRMVFSKFMPLPDELVDLIAIGNAMKSSEGENYQPLPSGPDLKDLSSGPKPPKFDHSNVEKVELPELPQESKQRAIIIGEYLTEKRKAENRAVLEYRKQLQQYRQYWFHPRVALQRLQESTPRMMESLQITSEEGLEKWRGHLANKVTRMKYGLGGKSSILNSVGSLIHVTEGYRPQWLSCEEVELMRKYRRTAPYKSLSERMSKPVNTDRHEMITLIEQVRK